MWAAIRRELARMLAYYRQHTRDQEDVGETYSEYYLDLVEALSESRDVADIDLLIDTCGSGKTATDALVRFGETAVPALLRTVRGSVNDRLQIAGATFALADMLRASPSDTMVPVSEASREAIHIVARELVQQRLTLSNVIPVTTLALATGASDLREALERLATDPEEWTRRGSTDPAEIARGQQIIRGHLARAPIR